MSSSEPNSDGGSQGLPDVSEADTRDEPYFSIGSYGVQCLIDSLPADTLRDVFSDTPESELREIASDIEEKREGFAGQPENHEGYIKDLYFKQSVIEDMADSTSE